MPELIAKTATHALMQIPDFFKRYGILHDRQGGSWNLNEERTIKTIEIRNALICIEDAKEFLSPFVKKYMIREALEMLTGYYKPEQNLRLYRQNISGWRLPYSYGERLRGETTTDIDQLEAVEEMLKKEPMSRQAVMMIRRPVDLTRHYTPCTMAYNFFITKDDDEQKLNMTTIMRSNDVAQGGLPRNIFMNCLMQYYMATRLQINTGAYFHFVTNLHCYINKIKEMKVVAKVPYKDIIAIKSWPNHEYQYHPTITNEDLYIAYRLLVGDDKAIDEINNVDNPIFRQILSDYVDPENGHTTNFAKELLTDAEFATFSGISVSA